MSTPIGLGADPQAAPRVTGVIDIVGIGDGGWADLPSSARDLVTCASTVVGGRRHLALLPSVPGQRRRSWPSPLRAALPGLLAELGAAEAAPGDLVVLASGDPLRSGVGTTIVGLLGADLVRVHPAVSSPALARARLGWAAEETVVLTLVGRGLDLLRRDLDPGARLVLLCSSGADPAAIAALLRAEGCGASVMHALWHLGGPAEGRRTATADHWGDDPTPDLVVVAVEVDPAGARMRGALGVAPGLPESAFDTDGQLTKRDVRASALAHLRPWRGAVLWDLGAGTGTVGLEWARLAPGARTVAVERDPDRAARVSANAHALGVPRTVEVVVADVLDSVRSGALPDPDAVFVGGGLSPDLLAALIERCPPGTRLVAHAVTLGTEALLVQACLDHGGTLTRLAIEHARPLGRHLSWTPARPVVQWSCVLRARHTDAVKETP